MDKSKRKQLLQEYKNRCPEKGVISYLCKATEESFLGISEDTAADFNSVNVKLSLNSHPNKRLQELWNKYGEESFERTVIKILKYDDPAESHTEELEKLREHCLAENPKASKIWK